jgi:hypothetical protein
LVESGTLSPIPDAGATVDKLSRTFLSDGGRLYFFAESGGMLAVSGVTVESLGLVALLLWQAASIVQSVRPMRSFFISKLFTIATSASHFGFKFLIETATLS